MFKYGHRRSFNLLGILVLGTILTTACGTAASTSPGETALQRIEREKTITFAILNEVPYAYAEGGGVGVVTGEDPETLKAIMSMYGVKTYNAVISQTAGMIPGLLAKRWDVDSFGMTITAQRCKQVAFSNPVLASSQGLGVALGNPHNLHSYKDIAANPNLKVGMDRGASQLTTLQIAGVKPDQILQYGTTDETITALETGRVDATANLAALLTTALSKENPPKFAVAQPFATPTDASGKPVLQYTGDAFRKEDNTLREAFNAGLAKLQSSGQLKQIILKFGFAESDVPDPSVTAAQVCASS